MYGACDDIDLAGFLLFSTADRKLCAPPIDLCSLIGSSKVFAMCGTLVTCMDFLDDELICAMRVCVRSCGCLRNVPSNSISCSQLHGQILGHCDGEEDAVPASWRDVPTCRVQVRRRVIHRRGRPGDVRRQRLHVGGSAEDGGETVEYAQLYSLGPDRFVCRISFIPEPDRAN